MQKLLKFGENLQVHKNWRDIPYSWFWRFNIVRMSILPKRVYRVHAISMKTRAAFVCLLTLWKLETDKLTLRRTWKSKGPVTDLLHSVLKPVQHQRLRECNSGKRIEKQTNGIDQEAWTQSQAYLRSRRETHAGRFPEPWSVSSSCTSLLPCLGFRSFIYNTCHLSWVTTFWFEIKMNRLQGRPNSHVRLTARQPARKPFPMPAFWGKREKQGSTPRVLPPTDRC